MDSPGPSPLSLSVAAVQLLRPVQSLVWLDLWLFTHLRLMVVGQSGIWEAGPPDGSDIVCTEINIYTSNSFLYSAFYNFMYTFKGFNKIHQPFPDM